MDIALAVEELYGPARYGSAGDYQTLIRTWSDSRPVPTERQLADAWLTVLAKRAEQEAIAIAYDAGAELLTNDVAWDNLTSSSKVDLLRDILAYLVK